MIGAQLSSMKMKFLGYMRRAFRAIGERYDRIEDQRGFERRIFLCAAIFLVPNHITLLRQVRHQREEELARQFDVLSEKKTINPDDFAMFPLKPKEGPADVEK